MSKQVVYATHLRDVANSSRLQRAYEIQKEENKPAFYLLPSFSWLKQARQKQPGLLISTFDDLATYILDKAELNYLSISEQERSLFFQQFIREAHKALANDEIDIAKANGYADTYGQIKRLGLSIEDLPVSLHSLSSLFSQYEEKVVDERRLLDPENRILAAINHLTNHSNDSNLSIIMVDGFFDFSPLQALLIEALKKANVKIEIFLPHHERFDITARTVSELKEIGFVEQLGTPHTHLQASELKLISATTMEEQWKGIMEEIHLSQEAYEEIGILLVDERTALAELERYTTMYHIPVNIAQKRPVASTAIYSFLLSIIKGNDRSKTKWEQLPLVEQILKLYHISGLTFAKQKQLFLQSREWLDQEHESLFRMITELRLPKQASFVEYLSRLAKIMNELPLLAYWEKQFSNDQPASTLKGMVDEYKAFELIRERIESYQALLVEKRLEHLLITPDLFIEWLREQGDSLTLFSKRAVKKGVSIHSFRDISLFKGKKLFVVGMNEGAFPAPHHLSGYVQERDLVQLPVRFSAPTQLHFQEKQLAHFEQLFYVSEVILFTYVKGVDTNHPYLPSPILTELDLVEEEWSWKKRLSNGFSFSEQNHLEKLAYFLGEGFQSEGIPQSLQVIKDRQRRIEGAEEHLSVAHQEKQRKQVVSVTELESYARCPFRYAMERALEVNEPNQEQESVSPLEIGQVIHSLIEELYHEFNLIGRPFGSVEKSVLEQVPSRLLAMFEQKWDYVESQSPEISKFDLLLMKQQWQRRLEQWWQAEKKHFWDNEELATMEIMAFEKPVRLELEISDEESLILVGKVDRVDRQGNRFVIYDYKTGFAQIKMEEVKSGLKLQLPLYAYAIREELERLENQTMIADGASYISLKKEPAKRAGNGIWRSEHVGKDSKYQVSSRCRNQEDELGTNEFLEKYELVERIKELWQGLQSAYHVAPEECSNFCQYHSICRATAEQRNL
ncbi:PD-(D/E)XK nuclease family protein [Bacillus suaedae]|uniref:PD-(D/E)XK nuclease family protein n=1 Tax=Halalkalibacter suaedae TaxID=2822140 RepID=A0A940WXG1_9BACI|nr:PD-(D/E)XK nuclease family protein [Bacillus suaedae]MBP3949614.1 PD-(D/E)XK nuclease family protein [Bacillus suaedae]